ncbi:MAG: radical SAM family heme chaperone HemW [Thermodesulfobacteriota bacterium]
MIAEGAEIDPACGEEPPGLYLHIPFCKSKCAYCSFNSQACTQPPPEYLEALSRQIAFWSGHPWCQERIFSSLFIGGGTPTIYGERLAGLVSQCLGAFRFSEDAEVSVEANPNTVDAATLDALRRAGVNRLSLGGQSLSDRLLAMIGRTHTAAEVRAAVIMARQAGFVNLNLDLIYGLPDQRVADWQETLEVALSFAPEHLACYELTIEEGTPFGEARDAGRLVLPGEEEVLAMEEITHALAGQAGLQRYEISNYARPGFQCRHNLNYWRNGSYLGLGAGAVSCLSGMRVSMVDAAERYVALLEQERQPVAEAECLPLAASFRETVVMGLRLLEGVSVERLRGRFGLTAQEYYGSILEELQSQGLVSMGKGRLRLTERALPVANQVLARLV